MMTPPLRFSLGWGVVAEPRVQMLGVKPFDIFRDSCRYLGQVFLWTPVLWMSSALYSKFSFC